MCTHCQPKSLLPRSVCPVRPRSSLHWYASVCACASLRALLSLTLTLRGPLRQKNKANKNLSYEAQRVLAMAEKTDQPPEKKQHEQGMRYADKIRRRQPQGPFSEHYQKLQDDDEHSEDADSSDDDILTLKRRHGDSDDEDGDLAPLEYKKPEKRSKRRKALKEQLEQQQRTDVVFDDPSQIDIEAEQRKYSEKVVKSLEQEDSVDKELLRERLREKRRRRKEVRGCSV